MSADEVIAVTERLLGSVAAGDFNAYAALSDEALTCIEPETQGQIVEGLAFHRHFFDLGRGAGRPAEPPLKQSIVNRPVVRMLGRDHALIVYVRVMQNNGAVSTAEETRVWRRDPTTKAWKNIHFHRSSRL